MNKTLRFLVVLIVLLVTILTSLWKINSQTCPGGKCERGILGGESVSALGSRIVIAAVVPEKSAVQRGLTFVEFFAGY